MEIILKHYVEKIYKGIFFNEVSIKKVKDRDPLKIENDGKMQGFRFYDKEYCIRNGKSYAGKSSNYSNWVLFGERLSLKDVKERFNDKTTLIHNMVDNNYKYVCYTQVGAFLPMDDGDITYDELVNEKEKVLIKKKK